MFLISPRRYGKSSLIHGHALLPAVAKRGTLVEVTVSSFAYVPFFEGSSPSPHFRRDALGSGPHLAARRHPVRPRRSALHRYNAANDAVRPVFIPDVRSDRDVSRLAQEVFALPGQLAATPQGRGRAEQTSGDWAIQRRLGRACHACCRSAQRDVGYVSPDIEPSLMELLGPRRPCSTSRWASGSRNPPGRRVRLHRSALQSFRRLQGQGLGLARHRRTGPGTCRCNFVERLAHETWDEVRAAGRRRRRSTICMRRFAGC